MAKQDEFLVDDYWSAMYDELNELKNNKINARESILIQKKVMSKAYNHRLKTKTFSMGDLVWKTILPIEKKSRVFGNWSPSWDGPFKIDKMFLGNAYA